MSEEVKEVKNNQTASEIIRNVATNVKKVGTQGKIAAATVLAVIVFTIFFSAIKAGWDIEKIDITSWAANSAMSVALCLITMFAGETFFISYLSKRPDGMYQEKLQEYRLSREKVINSTQFLGQYINIQHEKEVRNARYYYLQDHGIENASKILLLTIDDIQYLDKPYRKELENGKHITFKPYTKKQIKIIRYVLEGNVAVKRVPKNFFLDSDSNVIGRSDYEQAGYISTEKEIIRHSGRIKKVVSMIVISLFWAGLTVEEFMKGDDVQARFVLTSRVVACVGGFVSGCFTSARVNRAECRELSLKSTFLSEFANFMKDHPTYFTLTDEEWEAEVAYDEYEKGGKNETTNG